MMRGGAGVVSRSMGIRRIRRAVREGRYEYSVHALEEMDDDGLTDADIRQVILKGNVLAELTGDPRGIRFAIRGNLNHEDIEVEVVCRFLPSALMRIITVYVVKE
jgi:hypothetical protein